MWKNQDAITASVQNLQFPITDSIHRDESGQGYVLRMAEANALSGLTQIKNLLGKSHSASLDGADAPALAKLFGADVDELFCALGNTAHDGNLAGFSYAGAQLGRSYFLNRSYPRICTTCVRAENRCRAVWDFALCTACDVHFQRLIEVCPTCNCRLSWNRCGVAICRCGYFFEDAPGTADCSEMEVAFARWIGARCAQSMAECLKEPIDRREEWFAGNPLMQLISPLDLNGGCHLVFALATIADYVDCLWSRAPRPRNALEKARRALFSANAVARLLLEGTLPKLSTPRPSAIVDLLADAADCRNTATTSLTRSVLDVALRGKPGADWSSEFPMLSQRNLF